MTMLIELWWWIEPLWWTGLSMLLVFGIIWVVAQNLFPDSAFANAILCIAVLPFLACILSFIAWLMANFGAYIISLWKEG